MSDQSGRMARYPTDCVRLGRVVHGRLLEWLPQSAQDIRHAVAHGALNLQERTIDGLPPRFNPKPPGRRELTGSTSLFVHWLSRNSPPGGCRLASAMNGTTYQRSAPSMLMFPVPETAVAAMLLIGL